ncbi:sensor histidine kinase [Pseudomonas aeruginosa]|nr:sensor histidine kinase [Pseudomonas aeruginosa]
MTPPGRLSLRLALLVGALGALLALALGAIAHWNLGRELEARERENLQLKLEQIRHSLEDDLDLRSDPAVQAHALQDQLVAHSGLHLSILDSRSGQPLMSFGDQAAASVAANRALLARLQADARQPVFQSWSTGNDQRLLSIGASMRMKNGTPVQVLLSSERNADERLLDGFLRATLLALPFLLPLIALAARWVVRAGLEPLNRFRRVAAQVSPQDLSYRIPEQNLPRELDSLARSFNHMLGRLEDGVRQLSQFSDDLAHELRAPICNLLVRNQVLLSQHRDGAAYREALESNAEELERLSRIVTDMLFLVQVDNPAIQAQFGCVALHEQAAKVIDLYEMVAEDKGVELRLSGNGFAHGDNLMIQRAISNLVSNAVRHTPQGGRIDVRIGERAGHTEVRVSNDGPGIPPEYLPPLFERFYRRAGRQTGAQAGTGLGLAIVQSIMAYHGGRAEAESVPQQKTHLRLLFPSTGAA